MAEGLVTPLSLPTMPSSRMGRRKGETSQTGPESSSLWAGGGICLPQVPPVIPGMAPRVSKPSASMTFLPEARESRWAGEVRVEFICSSLGHLCHSAGFHGQGRDLRGMWALGPTKGHQSCLLQLRPGLASRESRSDRKLIYSPKYFHKHGKKLKVTTFPRREDDT